jgi:hypothetical protein
MGLLHYFQPLLDCFEVEENKQAGMVGLCCVVSYLDIGLLFCRVYHLICWGLSLAIACIPFLNDSYGAATIMW